MRTSLLFGELWETEFTLVNKISPRRLLDIKGMNVDDTACKVQGLLSRRYCKHEIKGAKPVKVVIPQGAIVLLILLRIHFTRIYAFKLILLQRGTIS